MEGNLKGARHSLSSTGLSSRYSYSSQRLRQSYMSSKQQITPGHSRAASEASVPSPVPSLPTTRPTMLPKRSSSALGSFAGGIGVIDRSASLRSARSQEAMRESRLKTWMMDERSASSSIDLPRSASSTGHYYATRGSPTPSDLSRRPASQASEIRAQMSELKGRIYEIKERVRESSKRSSTMSLRTASPMDSEITNNQNEAYKTASSRKSVSPVQSPHAAEFAVKSPPKHYTLDHNNADEPEEYDESHYEDAEETLDDLEEELQRNEPHSKALGIYSQQHQQNNLIGNVLEELPEEIDEEDGAESVSGHTEYFEAEPVVVAERHEDREDAFDYENFFLHSAMGTYSRDQRRDSFSSESSVETTRAVSPLRTPVAPEAESEEIYDAQDSPLQAIHERNMSSDSVSSMASFQTATEGDQYDDENLDFEELDAVAQQVLNSSFPPTTIAVNRTSLSPRKHPGPSPLLPPPSPPPSAQPVLSKDALLASFVGFDTVDSEQDVHKDRALIESVVASLQNCCIELQRSSDGAREDFRERLLEAQRILEGGELEF
jgi:hypothetical protein